RSASFCREMSGFGEGVDFLGTSELDCSPLHALCSAWRHWRNWCKGRIGLCSELIYEDNFMVVRILRGNAPFAGSLMLHGQGGERKVPHVGQPHTENEARDCSGRCCAGGGNIGCIGQQ